MEVKSYFEITFDNLQEEHVGIDVIVNPHEFPMTKGKIVSWTEDNVVVKVGEKKKLTCNYEDVILCTYQWDRKEEYRYGYTD